MIRSTAATAAALLLAAGLAACDKADKGPKTLDQAKAEARQMQRPEPGQYKQITRITKFEVPGAPKEMVARIKAMMEGQGGNLTYCLTKADSDKGFEEMFKKVGEGECKYDRFDASASTIDAILVCDSGQGGTARMAMTGTVGKTGSQVTVDVDQKNARTPMGNAKIVMDLKTERLGDCPAAGASGKAG
jgi:hypothetical protein